MQLSGSKFAGMYMVLKENHRQPVFEKWPNPWFIMVRFFGRAFFYSSVKFFRNFPKFSVDLGGRYAINP